MSIVLHQNNREDTLATIGLAFAICSRYVSANPENYIKLVLAASVTAVFLSIAWKTLSRIIWWFIDNANGNKGVLRNSYIWTHVNWDKFKIEYLSVIRLLVANIIILLPSDYLPKLNGEVNDSLVFDNVWYGNDVKPLLIGSATILTFLLLVLSVSIEKYDYQLPLDTEIKSSWWKPQRVTWETRSNNVKIRERNVKLQFRRKMKMVRYSVIAAERSKTLQNLMKENRWEEVDETLDAARSLSIQALYSEIYNLQSRYEATFGENRLIEPKYLNSTYLLQNRDFLIEQSQVEKIVNLPFLHQSEMGQQEMNKSQRLMTDHPLLKGVRRIQRDLLMNFQLFEKANFDENQHLERPSCKIGNKLIHRVDLESITANKELTSYYGAAHYCITQIESLFRYQGQPILEEIRKIPNFIESLPSIIENGKKELTEMEFFRGSELWDTKAKIFVLYMLNKQGYKQVNDLSIKFFDHLIRIYKELSRVLDKSQMKTVFGGSNPNKYNYDGYLEQIMALEIDENVVSYLNRFDIVLEIEKQLVQYLKDQISEIRKLF